MTSRWHNIWSERTEVSPAPAGWTYWNSKMWKDWSDTESVFFQTTQNPELPSVSSLQLYCFNVKNKKRKVFGVSGTGSSRWLQQLSVITTLIVHWIIWCRLLSILRGLRVSHALWSGTCRCNLGVPSWTTPVPRWSGRLGHSPPVQDKKQTEQYITKIQLSLPCSICK